MTESMESESFSAFSPAEPAVDAVFVSKHNQSAEVYQIFKDEVDALLLAVKSPGLDHTMRIRNILGHCENLLAVFEDEKQYLMGDILCNWAIKQQKLSIATLWTQQLHYRQLDMIHLQFEYFGELLQQTLSGLNYLQEIFPGLGFDEAWSRFRHMAHYFLYYSIIVSRQPPSVVVKCGDAENHRRSRFWFNTELRVLGGGAFGIEASGEGIEVRCFLITDETAKQLLSNAYHDVFESEEFVIEPCTANFQRKENKGLRSKFEDMRVSKKAQLRRDSVATRRYCLCYSVQLTTSCGIELVGKKVSLPFAVLVGPKADVEAKLFLERSFADLVRRPLSDIPAHASAVELVDQMEMKFQAIIETPQKSTDGPQLIQPRTLSRQAKEHLAMRLKPTPQGFVALENFLKLPVAEEYQLKKNSTTEGDWKLVPYFDWFFKLAEIINKYLYQMWHNGLIYGFCSKEDSERMLMSIPRSVLLVRFSDIEYAKIKISVKDLHGEVRHHWYDHTDLNARQLTNELLANHKFAQVELIYPDIDLEVALGGREKPSLSRHPRSLGNDIYFDNQGAATSTF
ncbi:hypothetical protein PFISCL1PPCAC_162 [Pristionchus fissidentatus]|uniref:Signal transducer and activator of transcription b N-terminal domain-containing protein n=1 Tax=Pristionchus fissidentatus TaxID=1538716 RepID=A0AAV5USV9_9BILA|nr:hypothetical protein PFISCL1PPCAC_162 [Pristionchus fissidentatus]